MALSRVQKTHGALLALGVTLGAAQARAQDDGRVLEIVQTPEKPTPFKAQRRDEVRFRATGTKEPPSTEGAALIVFGVEAMQARNMGAVPGDGGGVQVGMRSQMSVLDRKQNESVLTRSLGGMALGYAPSLSRWIGEFHLQSSYVARAVGDPDGFYGGFGTDLGIVRTPSMLWSLVEIPQIHFSYHHLARGRVAELGARAGFVWIGRYNPDGARHALGGSVSPALFATVHARPFHATLDFRRMLPVFDIDRGPVDMGQALLCASLRGASLCLSGIQFRGSVRRDDGTSAMSSSWQAGLLLGVGAEPE